MSNEKAKDAAQFDALNTPVVQAYPICLELPPPQPLLTDAAFSQLVAEIAPSVQPENAFTMLQTPMPPVNIASEHDIDVSHMATLSFWQLMKASAVFNAQHAQDSEVNAWPAAINEQPVRAPEAAAAMDVHPDQAPNVALHELAK